MPFLGATCANATAAPPREDKWEEAPSVGATCANATAAPPLTAQVRAPTASELIERALVAAKRGDPTASDSELSRVFAPKRLHIDLAPEAVAHVQAVVLPALGQLVAERARSRPEQSSRDTGRELTIAFTKYLVALAEQGRTRQPTDKHPSEVLLHSRIALCIQQKVGIAGSTNPDFRRKQYADTRTSIIQTIEGEHGITLSTATRNMMSELFDRLISEAGPDAGSSRSSDAIRDRLSKLAHLAHAIDITTAQLQATKWGVSSISSNHEAVVTKQLQQITDGTHGEKYTYATPRMREEHLLHLKETVRRCAEGLVAASSNSEHSSQPPWKRVPPSSLEPHLIDEVDRAARHLSEVERVVTFAELDGGGDRLPDELRNMLSETVSTELLGPITPAKSHAERNTKHIAALTARAAIQLNKAQRVLTKGSSSLPSTTPMPRALQSLVDDASQNTSMRLPRSVRNQALANLHNALESIIAKPDEMPTNLVRLAGRFAEVFDAASQRANLYTRLAEVDDKSHTPLTLAELNEHQQELFAAQSSR